MAIKQKLKSPMAVNFISLVLLQGVNYLLPLISFPFLFRVLGVERWGLVTFGYSLMQYFVMFTDFGFNLSATKYISQHRSDPKAINDYLNSAMTGRFLLCLVSLLILLTLIGGFDKFRTDALFYLLYFGIIIGNVMFPMWFFQGMENMKYITVFNIIAKSLSFIPFFIFIRKPEDYMLVPVCYSFGFVLAGLVSLGLVCGNTAVGYYSAAEKLYQAYNQLLTPFTGVLFPHIAKSRDVGFFKKIFYRISFANIFCVAAALALSSIVLQIVYGTADPNIESVYLVLVSGCFVTIPSMLMGYPFLAAMGHPHYTNWTIVITSIVHITGLFILYLCSALDTTTVAMMVWS